ncbi:MAG: hypothetical protein HY975_04320 [Candidatus Kerfeldbacteria bacterium]|nr:hypothetical protein [Candidatus Kerfeldbacteria bacterium]
MNNLDVCPDCGQEVGTIMVEGEIVYVTHFIPGEEGHCRGSGRSVQTSVEE